MQVANAIGRNPVPSSLVSLPMAGRLGGPASAFAGFLAQLAAVPGAGGMVSVPVPGVRGAAGKKNLKAAAPPAAGKAEIEASAQQNTVVVQAPAQPKIEAEAVPALAGLTCREMPAVKTPETQPAKRATGAEVILPAVIEAATVLPADSAPAAAREENAFTPTPLPVLRLAAVEGSTAAVPLPVAGVAPARSADTGAPTVTALERSSMSPAENVPAVPELASCITPLHADPRTLEVGLSSGSSGWVKVRAELGQDGNVHALVSSAAGVNHSGGVHARADEITSYLATERIPVASVRVHLVADVAQGAAAGAQRGAAAFLDSSPQQQQRRQPQSAYLSPAQGTAMPAPGAALLPGSLGAAILAGTGSWLNVRA